MHLVVEIEQACTIHMQIKYRLMPRISTITNVYKILHIQHKTENKSQGESR